MSFSLISKSSFCCCLVAKSLLTLFDPMDCIPPGCSVHRISQAGILEWAAMSFLLNWIKVLLANRNPIIHWIGQKIHLGFSIPFLLVGVGGMVDIISLWLILGVWHHVQLHQHSSRLNITSKREYHDHKISLRSSQFYLSAIKVSYQSQLTCS